MNSVTPRKQGLLVVRIEETFCWQRPFSSKINREHPPHPLIITADTGLGDEAVIDGVKSRVFERPLFVHGVSYWWEPA